MVLLLLAADELLNLKGVAVLAIVEDAVDALAALLQLDLVRPGVEDKVLLADERLVAVPPGAAPATLVVVGAPSLVDVVDVDGEAVQRLAVAVSGSVAVLVGLDTSGRVGRGVSVCWKRLFLSSNQM